MRYVFWKRFFSITLLILYATRHLNKNPIILDCSRHSRSPFLFIQDFWWITKGFYFLLPDLIRLSGRACHVSSEMMAASSSSAALLLLAAYLNAVSSQGKKQIQQQKQKIRNLWTFACCFVISIRLHPSTWYDGVEKRAALVCHAGYFQHSPFIFLLSFRGGVETKGLASGICLR